MQFLVRLFGLRSKYYNRVTTANVLSLLLCPVVCKKGGVRGGPCPAPWGAHQHFIQPFKHVKFRPNYAKKNAYFLKNAVKSPQHPPLSSGGCRLLLCFQYNRFQHTLFPLL